MQHISVGKQSGPKDDHNMYKIWHNDRFYYLPEMVYLFWEQFTHGADHNVARASFIAAGLPGELFDEYLGALKADGLIAIISKAGEVL